MRALLITLLIIISHKAICGKDSTELIVDTNYIKTFPRALTIKPYLDYKINRFFMDDDITGGKLNYQTYQAPNIGFGAAYKWMSFLATIAPIYPLDKEEKGITRQMDIQWNIYLKSISTDLRYSRYQGYFLNNSEELDGHNEKENGHYLRPDLATTSYGINLRYNFNTTKYSQKAVYSQTEKQLKNAGAFGVGVRWNVFTATADSSFIPININPQFDNFSVDKMQIFDQGIGLGYSYSFVKGNWFANASVMPWFIFQVFNFNDLNAGKEQMLGSAQIAIQARGAFGYNGKKDYCGIVFVSDQMRSRWKDGHDVGHDFGNIKIFYARRFTIN